jgi:hypothetical protein
MKKIIITAIAIGTTTILGFSANASATTFGSNITIYDQKSDGNTWHQDTEHNVPNGEDNEVEPGMLHGQQWDLEGFYLDGTKLTAVGGFDFINGAPNYAQYSSGDLFLDINGDATFGTNATDPSNILNGYDIVLDLDFSDMSNLNYDIIDLRSGTIGLLDVEGYNSPESSPWKYDSGGTFLDSGVIEYTSTAAFDNSTLGLLGYNGNEDHNAFTVDIGFLVNLGLLSVGEEFTAHFTMGCGNDNLMGRGTAPVPEPATMLLFGTGLVGLAGAYRRKKK